MYSIAIRFFTTLAALLALHGCDQPHDVAPPSTESQITTDDIDDPSVAALTRKGGLFDVDDDGNIASAYFSDVAFSPADLAYLATFTELKELNLSTCEVDDSIWQSMCGMAKLESLTLWRAKITDSGMENLRDCPNLKTLDIRQTRIGDDGLANVAQLKSLEKLELLGTRVTSAGLVHLSGLSQLKELGLVQTEVDDSGLQHIAKLNTLVELSLEGSDITDAGLRHVGQLTNLRLLTIHNTAITERGLVHLEGLSNLQTFYLCVPVSKLGLRSLKKMTRLEHLYIGDTDDNTQEFLSSQLPNVGVY